MRDLLQKEQLYYDSLVIQIQLLDKFDRLVALHYLDLLVEEFLKNEIETKII